jgi:hypothetical protein
MRANDGDSIAKSYAVFAVSVGMLSSLTVGRLMPHVFCEAAPEGRLGVRQLAAAFAFSLAILTHPKAQASLRPPRASPPIKKYAALGVPPAFPGKSHAASGVCPPLELIYLGLPGEIPQCWIECSVTRYKMRCQAGPGGRGMLVRTEARSRIGSGRPHVDKSDSRHSCPTVPICR